MSSSNCVEKQTSYNPDRKKKWKIFYKYVEPSSSLIMWVGEKVCVDVFTNLMKFPSHSSSCRPCARHFTVSTKLNSLDKTFDIFTCWSWRKMFSHVKTLKIRFSTSFDSMNASSALFKLLPQFFPIVTR